jgi:hypothetical protein
MAPPLLDDNTATMEYTTVQLQHEPHTTGSASRFNANAAPFHPGAGYETYIDMCIYNDGHPSLTMTTHHDVNELLHGIQDEALDENFPPNAIDAAELDAMEDFVETLAILQLLEEREERARNGFCHIKKRWEARRAQGLIGRPHPARHLVDANVHLVNTAAVEKSYSLVVHNVKMRAHEMMMHQQRNALTKNKIVHMHPRNVIQQPRKQN